MNFPTGAPFVKIFARDSRMANRDFHGFQTLAIAFFRREYHLRHSLSPGDAAVHETMRAGNMPLDKSVILQKFFQLLGAQLRKLAIIF